MPIKNLLRKNPADEALKKLKDKTRIFNKDFSRMVLLFLFGVLPLEAVIIASGRELIMVPDLVLVFLEAIVIVLMSYIMATVFIRLTVYLIPDSFGSAGEQEEKILLSKMYMAFIYSVAVLVVFWQLGIGIQNIAIFLGLLTTGFAFALRDIIFSYFAWFILLTKKPFKIGDYIEVGDEEGIVKHIGLFYVVVDPYPYVYNDFYKIPNKTFLEKTIRNHGKGNFKLSFDLYLKDIPSYLEERIENIREKSRLIGCADARFHLGSDKDGVKLITEYKATFEGREKTRHQLISIILEELGLTGVADNSTVFESKKVRYSV
ncbi:mechanosensitive ion channel domain-containing protein [Methanolobus halotolerans]|uniref:Mechanosensitive ion channel protein MscS n=1 Tax=Methanolobus halotolerans TaxID=2052935 RepID=A0A4E0PZC4_9EURY|nr:mechanosensitive ion channel domain-containing protein [Methanolobus halotolerans]TGC11012.1 mechanosensitive ion channel protein MscS [Methanolobus halotolerans]